MTISAILTLDTEATFEQTQEDDYLPCHTLESQQAELLVSLTQQAEQPHPLLLKNRQDLTDYLKRLPVTLIRIDQATGEVGLRFWADACKRAGKVAFLQLPLIPKLPRRQSLLGWQFKRLIDWIAAILLLVALSPAMLILAVLVLISSPGPIFFRQWRVGEQGKLFQILKFRTMVVNAEQIHHQVMRNQVGLHKCEDDPRITPLGRWMRKYSLDELPQFFNVLRGEMSLVGPRPWALYDAIRLSPEGQQRLNALPGVTGAWQVGARSTLLDLDAVNQVDLEYLYSWSLAQDLKILLLTIPRVLVGFGAC